MSSLELLIAPSRYRKAGKRYIFSMERTADESLTCLADADDVSSSKFNSNKVLRTTTFNLEPEIIIPRSNSNSTSTMSKQHHLRSTTMTANNDSSTALTDGMELESPTEAQMKEIRERSRKRIKKLVAAVGISLTVLCVILVIVSLSLGTKLEELKTARK